MLEGEDKEAGVVVDKLVALEKVDMVGAAEHIEMQREAVLLEWLG